MSFKLRYLKETRENSKDYPLFQKNHLQFLKFPLPKLQKSSQC
ncbi:hypothetical protein HMPREF9514_03064 [Enterococcus faecalis TX0855]|nr:hypothetical protein HMPREF9514_03064 [Enterococcus faecalis TX0855]EFU17507.1 hypothetical protein HMPREF9519_01517 [Enterococcus faecalis TX1346]EPH76863.1 hypothetical protein D926_01313 [Enterococcus faecalis D811610-10]